MEATQRYRLKLAIDEALKQYGASAVAWETQWSQLRIIKYDHPYSADRSIIADWYIKGESDWNAQRSEIEQMLHTLGVLIGKQVRVPDAVPEGYEAYVGQDAVITRRFGDGRLEVKVQDGGRFIFHPEEME